MRTAQGISHARRGEINTVPTLIRCDESVNSYLDFECELLFHEDHGGLIDGLGAQSDRHGISGCVVWGSNGPLRRRSDYRGETYEKPNQ
jgi:hypothetical protein